MEVAKILRLGFSGARRCLFLSLVNTVLTYISIDNIARCLMHRGIFIGFKISLPTAIPTLWHFVEVPGRPSVMGFLGLVVGFLVAILVSFIEFLYLSRLLACLGVEPRAGFRRALHIVVFNLALELYTLMVALIRSAIPALTILAVLAFLPLYYLVYATPYLIVLEDLDIVTAVRRAIDIAKKRDHALYILVYIAIIFVTSPLFTIVAVNGKLPGIVVMSLIAGPLGLWLTASTAAMIVLHRVTVRENSVEIGTA